MLSLKWEPNRLLVLFFNKTEIPMDALFEYT